MPELEEDSGYAPCQVHHARIRELEAELMQRKERDAWANERIRAIRVDQTIAMNGSAQWKARAEKAERERDVLVASTRHTLSNRDQTKARVAELEAEIRWLLKELLRRLG